MSNESEKVFTGFNTLLKENFLGHLECPVCMNLLIPPIFQCNGGHSLCSNCCLKINTCPQCKREIGTLRNFTLEKVVNAFLACPYVGDGCTAILDKENLQVHLKSCSFRPIECSESECKSKDAGSGCKGKLVPSSKYIDHLSEIHKCPVGVCDPNGDGWKTVWKWNSYSSKREEEWPIQCVNFDDRWFLFKMFIFEDKFIILLTFFGTMEDASKYKAEIHVGSPNDAPPASHIQFVVGHKFPSIIAHVLTPNDELPKNTYPMEFPKRNLCELGETDENGYVRFATTISVSKKENTESVV